MTSQDSNTDMNNITLLLRELIASNREQIAEMKALSAQIQKDNAEFRERITKENSEFREKISTELTNFEGKIHKELEILHAEITVLQSDVRVQNTRIDDLIHWNYWLIAFVVAFFTLPSIAEGIKSLLKAIAHSITSTLKGKRSEGK